MRLYLYVYTCIAQLKIYMFDQSDRVFYNVEMSIIIIINQFQVW